jgi:hypothetical protein
MRKIGYIGKELATTSSPPAEIEPANAKLIHIDDPYYRNSHVDMGEKGKHLNTYA